MFYVFQSTKLTTHKILISNTLIHKPFMADDSELNRNVRGFKCYLKPHGIQYLLGIWIQFRWYIALFNNKNMNFNYYDILSDCRMSTALTHCRVEWTSGPAAFSGQNWKLDVNVNLLASRCPRIRSAFAYLWALFSLTKSQSFPAFISDQLTSINHYFHWPHTRTHTDNAYHAANQAAYHVYAKLPTERRTTTTSGQRALWW